MRERLQSSTAHPMSFLMVLTSDHVTGATGLTPVVTISKDGGAFASPAGAVTELANGWYSLAGNATDRNTLGQFLIHATGTASDPCDRDFTITGYDPFDSVRLGLTGLANAVPGAAGGLFIAGTNAATTITTSLTTHFVGTVDTVTTYTGNTPQTGDSFARVGALGAGLTALAPSASALSSSTWTATLTSYLSQLGAAFVGSTSVFSTASLVNAPTGGSAPTVGAIVAGMAAGSVASVSGSVGSIAGITFPSNFNVLSIDSSGNVKVQGEIKRNVALAGFPFYMALTSDHVSPATGKVITSTVSLNGGAFAATANAATEIGSGWYAINLASTDLNGATVGLSFAAAGCDTTVLTAVTQP